jgi:hypothetical protein
VPPYRSGGARGGTRPQASPRPADPPAQFLETLYRLASSRSGRTSLPRLLRFYASQVLGYYEPDGNELVVVDHGAAAASIATLV